MIQKILTKFAKAVVGVSVLTAVTNISTNLDPAQAYSIYFGEDLSSAIGNRVSPLPVLPNASQAEADFLASLSGVGTEYFENFYVGKRAPATLTFPGAGTAILSGPGFVNRSYSSDSRDGRYPIFSNKNWVSFAGDGGLNIDFSEGVAAFGFYMSDLESNKLVVDLTLTNGSKKQLLVDNSVLPDAGSGSVLYYGLIAEDESELFTSVSLELNGLDGQDSGKDGVGFDNMTIGSLKQIVNPPKSVPEPSSALAILTVGMGMATLAGKRYWKSNK